jgi:hypothetical protein
VRHATAASDQYSLAVVLYECATGKPPFGGEGTLYDLIERVRTTTPRPPSASRAELPAAFDDVMMRALARDPKARFDSVRAFARALLPFASEGAHARDFAERPGESERKGPEGPSIRRASGRTTAASASPSSSSMSRGGIGPLPCAPGTSPFHIKGVFYKGLLHHVDSLIGMDAFCELLPDSALRFFVRQPFVASGRYDVLPFVPLVDTLARRLGKSMEELVTIGAASQARYDSKTVYKLIFDTQHPEALADRVRRFNTQIYDFGTFGGSIPKPNHILLDFSGIPAYLRPWFGTMHVQYAVESMRIAGSSDVAIISHVTRDAGVKDGFPLLQFLTELRWS